MKVRVMERARTDKSIAVHRVVAAFELINRFKARYGNREDMADAMKWVHDEAQKVASRNGVA